MAEEPDSSPLSGSLHRAPSAPTTRASDSEMARSKAAGAIHPAEVVLDLDLWLTFRWLPQLEPLLPLAER